MLTNEKARRLQRQAPSNHSKHMEIYHDSE